MNKLITRTLQAAALTVISFATTPSLAGSEPTGLWYDDTGRGAVEITKCGGGLCGKLVWLKDAGNGSACGTQIIGNVKPAGGTWNGGWIYDPEEDAKYNVEITPLGSEKLKVVGYAGTKLLSQTMIWKRAPADLKRCQG
jgi:uncharacterized protein (DUF2147 family)